MYIDKNGNKWYKGNLHTHTTRSDGKLSPEATKDFYRGEGYDFLALTDHWVYGEGSKNGVPADDGMLILAGTEYNFNGEDVVAGVFHIVGIGCETDPMETIGRNSTAQETIDEINRCGGVAILAHPAWSLNTYDMIMNFHGLAATEIYNSVSGAPRNCRPYSGDVVDQLAARGHAIKLVSSDDTHFYLGEQGLSYIMVNLGDKPLNRENVLEALRAGNYYATQGPHYETSVENRGNVDGKLNYGEYIVKCPIEDGVTRVTFYTNRPWENLRCVFADKEPLTEARCPIDRNDTFIRAELQTAAGKKGWSQITLLDPLK